MRDSLQQMKLAAENSIELLFLQFHRTQVWSRSTKKRSWSSLQRNLGIQCHRTFLCDRTMNRFRAMVDVVAVVNDGGGGGESSVHFTAHKKSDSRGRSKKAPFEWETTKVRAKTIVAAALFINRVAELGTMLIYRLWAKWLFLRHLLNSVRRQHLFVPPDSTWANRERSVNFVEYFSCWSFHRSRSFRKNPPNRVANPFVRCTHKLERDNWRTRRTYTLWWSWSSIQETPRCVTCVYVWHSNEIVNVRAKEKRSEALSIELFTDFVLELPDKKPVSAINLKYLLAAGWGLHTFRPFNHRIPILSWVRRQSSVV